MFQARVRADARWPMLIVAGGQHFSKAAFTQVLPGTEAEVRRNPDMEIEEVIAVEPEPADENPPDEPSGDVPLSVDLEALKKDELLAHAEAMGVTTTTAMTKAQIIAAIQSAEVKA